MGIWPLKSLTMPSPSAAQYLIPTRRVLLALDGRRKKEERKIKQHKRQTSTKRAETITVPKDVCCVAVPEENSERYYLTDVLQRNKKLLTEFGPISGRNNRCATAIPQNAYSDVFILDMYIARYYRN